MSYHQRRRALSGVSTELPQRLPVIRMRSLGSLGDDPPAGTTLSQPTLLDPATAQFQQQVLAYLKQGDDLMRTANLTKWLQVVATVCIPLTAAIWRGIFKKGVSVTGV